MCSLWRESSRINHHTSFLEVLDWGYSELAEKTRIPVKAQHRMFGPKGLSDGGESVQHHRLLAGV